MAHLTKATVAAAKAPANGQAFIRDDLLKGFALRVIPSGTKTFLWEGRIKRRVRRITIGRFPDLSVALARAEAMRIRTAIAEGRDPYSERQTEQHELVFGDLRKRYVEEHAKAHRRTWLRDERRLARCSDWDGRRLSDITAPDILKLQHRVAEEHGRVESNRTLELLRAVFNKGAKWGLTKDNPALGFERFREVPRARFLSDDELRRLNASLLQEDEPWRSYFPLLLLLGLRRGELAGARWEAVDFDAGTLRLMRTKSGEPRLAPLPGVAVELLRNLPSRGESEFLFPSRGKTGHLVEVKSAWARLCRGAKLTNVTIHDLRRTVGSRMAIAGVNLPTIGSVLGHTGLNATQIYARLDMEAARRALDANAATLPLSLPAVQVSAHASAAK